MLCRHKEQKLLFAESAFSWTKNKYPKTVDIEYKIQTNDGWVPTVIPFYNRNENSFHMRKKFQERNAVVPQQRDGGSSHIPLNK